MGKIENIHLLLKNGSLSACELCEKYCNYINQINQDVNGYITICAEKALRKAQETDDKLRNGININLLDAIPYSLKDNISTEGILTTCGSKMLADYIPAYNSTVAELLKDSLLLGKTNMDEFAMGSTSETSFFGAASNPYNLSDITGGSSGGSAASVASDMCVFSLGSDTGGSVRLPAALCGCVGFKPTYGVISRFGLISFASSFDTIGIITRCIDDCSIVFDNIAVKDKRDMTNVDYSKNEYVFSNVKKIGILEFSDIPLSDDNQNAINNVVDVISVNKISVDTLFSPLMSYLSHIYYILSSAQASSNLARYDGVRYGYRTAEYADFRDMISKSRTEAFGKEVKRRIILGNYILESGYYEKYYSKAYYMMLRLREYINKVFETYDIVMLPVSGEASYKKEYYNDKITDMYAADAYNVFANLCEIPSVSMPCYINKNSRPVSLQFMSRKYSDKSLLKFAKELEIMLNINTEPIIGGNCLGL